MHQQNARMPTVNTDTTMSVLAQHKPAKASHHITDCLAVAASVVGPCAQPCWLAGACKPVSLLLNMIAIMGTSDQTCWLAKGRKSIILLLL